MRWVTDFKKEFAMTKLKTARIGDTLYVFDAASESKVRENIVPDGHAMQSNGQSEWIIDEPVVDVSKGGSAAYTWDRTGNKIKYSRIRCVKDSSGKVTRKFMRFVFKSYE